MFSRLTIQRMLGLALTAVSLVPFAPIAATAAYAQAGGSDAQILAEVTKALDHKQFAGVHAVVQDGLVTLTGSVDLYAEKSDADHKARKQKNVTALRDEIIVAAGEIDDASLRTKLATKLATDRVGFGTTAFNAFTLQVDKGVVTLGGQAYGPTDKNSALELVAYTKGVKDVVDHIAVAPLSGEDDRIRLAEFNSIYGFPTLSRYAIDPAKPIRIVVANGRVTLVGVVNTKAELETANIRANSVPGVFQVTNDLQVAGAAERP